MGLFSRSADVPQRTAGLSIVLGEKQVTAGWWHVQDDQIETQQISQLHSFANHQEGVVEVDGALQELTKASEELNAVVFGVEPGWMVGKGELAEEAKAWLKKICDALTLEALGYVVTLEAYQQTILRHHPQANCVLVYVTASTVYLTVLRQGSVQLVEQVGFSGTLVSDVVEALARHETAEAIWPAKVWLMAASYSPTELQAMAQSFENFEWSDVTPWSAAPMLEVVSARDLLQAVSAEAGRAALGLPIGGQIPADEPRVVPVVDDSADSEEATPSPNLMQRLGSLLKREEEVVSHHPFIIGGVVLGLLTVLVSGWLYLRMTSQVEVTIVPRTTRITQQVPIQFVTTGASAANGTVTVQGRAVSAEVSVTKNTPSTGVKLVGEKAKGQVTVLNKTTALKTFPAGTVLSAGSLQFVTDAEVSVASASVQTAGDTETKTFGKTAVAVTASKIGPESNIGTGTTLTVANFDQSTYAAVAETALSGGTSREARAIAEVDRQKVLEDARKEAISQAEPLLRQQIQEGEYALPTGQLQISKRTFTAEVGDEVEAVGVTVEAEVRGVAYKASDVREVVLAALQGQVPSGSELLGDKLELLSNPDSGSTSSAQVRLVVDASAPIRPMVETGRVIEAIAGQQLTDLSSRINQIVPVTEVRTAFTPSLASRILRSLPGANRIQVKVE